MPQNLGEQLDSLAVILAAGESRRMRLPKALLAYSESETFLQHLFEVFESAGCRTLAVLGAGAEQISRAHPSLELVLNPSWGNGQFSSAVVGLKEAAARNARRVLLHPVDTPMLQPSSIEALLSGLGEGEAVVPQYRGAPGHPLVLSAGGARKIAEQKSAPHLEAALRFVQMRQISVDDPGVVMNFNTSEEYQRAFGHPPRIPVSAQPSSE
jgi:molybdenum cofactor cytidylyltransferase